HAADEHYAVALVGGAVHEGLDTFRRRAERDNLERADDRATHGFLDDPVVGEDIGLALGGGGAVAPHCRENERTHSQRLPVIDSGAHDGSDVGDAAAADTDGYPGPRFQPGREWRGRKLLADRGWNIAQGAVGEVLTNQKEAGERHLTILTFGVGVSRFFS